MAIHGSTWLYIKDQEFQKSREVLLSKTKQLLVEQGKGNHPQAATELTDAEEGLLFRFSEFGDKNPEALQRTVWWLLALHFGVRARDESRKLKWRDILFDLVSFNPRLFTAKYFHSK